MRTDKNTTIDELKQLLRKFREKRDWAQFHDPKNLAEAISIEAAELLQLFLWRNPETVTRAIKTDHQLEKAVEEELADVFCFALNFANSLKIDVSQMIRRKIALNNVKYPISKSKGVATKYDKL
jgi:NTP pyrophosphatase (non-canonical NTP hydrolase)